MLDLLVAVDDAAAGEVVRRELHHNAVLGEDADVVLAHLAADVRENLVAVGQLHAEHRVRKCLYYGAFHLDDAFFFRHNLFFVSLVWSGRPGAPQRSRLSGGHDMGMQT
ncbi:hypothetical protein AERO9AM_60115 [Aeromicrobium sp. 9AM]|nr:hypothetical protein AERO9AM_60115 [Aeromicrobium sp. 9AM]